MSSIGDRIRFVLDSKRVKNASAWCTKAGLPRTYLAMFQFREREGKPIEMSVATAAALAEAANVSFLWLAVGQGSPDGPGTVLPPNLRAVAAKAPKGTYPEALISQASLARDLIGEPDLPEDVWLDYLEGLRREGRRVGLEVAAARLDSRGMKR